MWVQVASLNKLKKRKKLLVNIEEKEIALFWIGDRVYALRNRCVHRGHELVKGTVFAGRVICPGHQWAFELSSGYCQEKRRCQPTYEVKVEGDAIYVQSQEKEKEVNEGLQAGNK